MQSKVELYIVGSGTTLGQIQLYPDEPLSIEYSIQDITDISKRSSSSSQNFSVPANKETNKLFNHIFNIGSDASFNPATQTPAYILVDNLMVFQGNLQLTNIKVKDKNPITYDVIVYGEVADFSKTLGDSYLTDLDFSELNHFNNVSGITYTWTANTAQLGYYYPLIDYGYDYSITSLNPGLGNIVYDSGSVTSAVSDYVRDNNKNWVSNAFVNYQINITSGTGAGQTRTITGNSDKVVTLLTDWTTIPDASSTYTITSIDISNSLYNPDDGIPEDNFKPAISNKYLFDKILRNAQFSYESSFLNSSAFTETIIPYNGGDNIILSSSTTDFLSFEVSTTSNATGISVFTPNFNFNDYNPNGYYNNTTKHYTCPVNASMKIGFKTTYSLSGTANPFSNYIVVKFYRTSYFGGVSPFYEEQARLDPNTVTNVKYNLSVETPPLLDDTLGSAFIPAQAQEQFWVTVQFTPFDPGVGLIYWSFDPNEPQYHGTSFYNIPGNTSVAGGIVDFNSCIPKKIKQIDYLKSIFTMFNLMVVPKKNNPKQLLIEPRQEYFNSVRIKDWSNKIDVSQQIDETLISEQQARQVYLTYKQDNDYYNKFYYDDTNKVYGEYIKTIENEWLDPNSTKKMEVIFSPTPMENAINCEDIILPKIGKLESSGAFGRTDFNIRFLRKNPYLMPTLNGTTIKMKGLNAQASYPFSSNLDHPFESTIDYNFGTIDYAFYNTPGYSNLQSITPNNLVNLYWKEYLDDISDKNSKLIKCKIKLTPADMADFDYNDTIYIEGLTDDGGHYFNINKITYTPTSDAPADVELIKINRKPSDLLSSNSINSNKKTTKRNNLQLGGAKMNSTNSIAVGRNTVLGFNSDNSVVVGANNYVGSNSPNSFVQGNNNFIGNNTINSYVIGNNNIIGSLSATSASTIISGVTIFGNNYTATTSDTVYVPNIQFTTTGGTINGVTINSITAATIGGILWSSGSGINSIIANNTTPNLGSGHYSFVANGYKNSATTSYSSVINGKYNLVSGNFAIAGGKGNIASGYYSNTLGGLANKSTSRYSFIGNGKQNEASGQYSFVGNGLKNIASGNGAVIVGGYQPFLFSLTNNVASGINSFIGNGFLNSATTIYSSVINGQQNLASGNYSSVVNGYQNKATAGYSFVGGGKGNLASGNSSFIGAGGNNTASGNNSIVVGGANNISGARASIVGGSTQLANGAGSFIGNGSLNSATTQYSFIGNGVKNLASGNHSSVVNGYQNKATAGYSFVGGGKGNLASGNYSFIGGGYRNSATTFYSSVLGGNKNIASGYLSSIGGGGRNTSYGVYSSINGGRENRATGNYSSICGGKFNLSSGYRSTVIGGYLNSATTTNSISGGYRNLSSGFASSILAGTGHTVTGRNSAIIGGGSITGSSDDTVYVPNLNLQTNKGISFGTGATRVYREIPIGDWNMDTTLSKNIPHSLSTTEWQTVRSLQVMIIDDLTSKYDSLNGYAGDGGFGVDSTNIFLQRTTGGYFDNTSYDSTSFNRGFINFWYTPD